MTQSTAEMNTELNYKHLYYFWVTAKEGGMSHAAARLGMAVQTMSAQVRQLERELGHSLFKPAGSRPGTDRGRPDRPADWPSRSSSWASSCPAAVRDSGQQTSVRLVVGISDGLPKLAVRDLLSPVLDEPSCA
jgi:LysR family transcriptional regulator, transcriptional activator of nhaA